MGRCRGSGWVWVEVCVGECIYSIMKEMYQGLNNNANKSINITAATTSNNDNNAALVKGIEHKNYMGRICLSWCSKIDYAHQHCVICCCSHYQCLWKPKQTV